MRKRWLALALAGAVAGSSVLAGCGAKQAAANAQEGAAVEEATVEEAAVDEDAVTEEEIVEENVEVPELEGYELLWHDEFSGDALDESIWSYDPHEPGWTNAELQEYTTSTDNVFVKNGKLVLKAIKTQDERGKDYYTSGKVKTQNKQDFMYGKVIARAKVPVGQGLWPAIWMMPTKESLYGNWPKCGEIDIMEVLGHQPDTTYATIHYGVPHSEQQGIYRLEKGTFADDFHDYSVEWEPGEMRFFVDDVLVQTVNDWFSADEGADDKPYPAPFNQTFYVQLNLAVGGTWPGNPDDKTDFDKAEFAIDYIRVYQKPEYDTDVKKPEKEFRAALDDGNLIYNGDFATKEALDDEELWSFLLFEDGKGSAAIEDGVLTITTQAEGVQEYSVQLVQPCLPMIKGNKYRLSFDACAAEDRQMKVAVTAPTAGWVRYLNDTKVELGTDWQTYTYEFEMKDKDDNNGRFELNMGAQGSTAEIYVKNVRMELIEE